MIKFINNDNFTIEKEIFEIKNFLFKKTYNFFVSKNINLIYKGIKFFSKKNHSVILINNKSIKSINILRHSCAHLLAHSISNLFKDVKFSVGPVIKNGFYYDFYYNGKISFNDLKNIENEMFNLSNCKIDIQKEEVSKEYAINIFYSNKYKKDIITKLDDNKIISIYNQNSFIDLCKGPHINNTKNLKYFKIIKISGAYWKNDKSNEMLYRIYGTCWNNKKSLISYINKTNKIKNLDHRIIGKKLNLFDFYNHSPGLVFWNRFGWSLFKKIKMYILFVLNKTNYYEVNTPVMNGYYLFDKSGHISKFSENMFIYSFNNSTYVLKPMNCPCHISIFNNFYKKSYKNLPFRISEFGSCFRKELSGTLHGLMRLKNFTQDDGHIFCSENQIKSEIIRFIHSLKKVYYKFDFKKFMITLSKKPKNINDNLLIWKKAEMELEQVIKKLGMNYIISNDGAFYGPKLEFSLRDKFNRMWQCGTIQVDFFTSIKLNANYVDYNCKIKNPVILHRAILGSIERFIGITLEHNDGFLPFFITPIQFLIIYLKSEYLFYAKSIYNILIYKYNINISLNKERLEYNIKDSILKKIPYVIIIGKKEYISKSVTLRDNKTSTSTTLYLKDLLLKIKKF